MSAGANTSANTSADAAAAMDRMYRHQRFVYDATRRHYLLGRDRLVAELAPGSGRVLEVGCGAGRNLVRAARRHPEARFCGLDVSAAMLDTARASLARRRLADRVSLVQADATAFDAATLFDPPGSDSGSNGGSESGFDRVYVSYVLSMIPDWRAALERAADAVAPGGRLHLVDFGEQERLPSAFRRGLRAWLALFGVYQVAALPEAVADLARARGWRARTESLSGGYAAYAVLERPA